MTSSSWARHAGPILALCVAAGALYGRVIGYDFVRYDDHELLVDHYSAIRSADAIAGALWRDSFAVLGPQSKGVYYRPLLVASYGIEARWFGPDPAAFHATNLALHAIATCLAYALLVAFGCGRALATGLALVLLAHPASALVAAWIPCRNESMLAIACIGATLALLAFLRRGSTAALALCVALYAAALLTKESGGALLVALAALAAVRLQRSSRSDAGGAQAHRRELRRLAWAGAAAVAISAGWAALRHHALGRGPVGAANVADNAAALLVYLGKLVFPIGLAAVPHPADTSLWPGVAASAVLAAAIAWTGRHLVGPAGFGLVWCAVFLLPAALVPRTTWGLEHRIYLPLVGLLIFAAHLPPPARGRAPAWAAPALAFAAAAALAVATARRLPEFADPITYWESAARAAPHSPLAASRVAFRYFEAGRFRDVPAAAERALALDERQPDMLVLRGIAYAKQGDLARAEADFQRTLEIDPENEYARTHLERLERRRPDG